MKRGLWILKGIVFVALLIVVFGLVTMLLWNWLVPELFNGPAVTFAQAIGLLLLTKILLWSVGKGRRGPGHCRDSVHWKSHWREKWSTLTPEEREKLKERMKGKWCRTEKSSPVAGTDNATG